MSVTTETLLDAFPSSEWPLSTPPAEVPPVLADLLERVVLLERSIAQTPVGTVVTVTVATDADLELPLEPLPLTIVVRGVSLDAPATVRAVLDEPWSVEVSGAGLALRLAPGLLRPVEAGQAHAELLLEGGVRVSADGLELSDPDVRLSLPASEIGDTGIIVSLEGVELALSKTHSPDAVFEHGYDESFLGVYAASSSIRLLSGFDFGVGGAAGLLVEGTEVLVSQHGLSCAIHTEFFVDDDGATLDGADVSGQFLASGWPLALRSLHVDVVENLPVGFRATGLARLPLLDLVLHLEVGLQLAAGGWVTTGRLATTSPAAITVPFGSVSYDEVVIEGEIHADGVRLGGVVTGLSVDLDPVHVDVSSAQVSLTHQDDHDELRVQLAGVVLGPLGTVESAELVISEREQDGTVLRRVFVETTASWQDLHARLSLPEQLPLPPDDATVTVLVDWEQDTAADGHRLRVRFGADATGADSLWGFVPAAYRPQVEEVRLHVDVSYASAAEFSSAGTGSSLSGEASVELAFRLPPLAGLPGSDLVEVTTGDADGLVRARVVAGITSGDGADAQPSLQAAIDNPLSVDVQIPGLAQPEAPVHTELTSATLEVTGTDGAAQGALVLSGAFELRPVRPPPSVPLASHLEGLFDAVDLGDVTGTATLTLGFGDGRAVLDLDCRFDDADVDLDVFDLLAGLTTGMAPAPGAGSSGEIDLDIEVGFGLRGVRLRLGSLQDAAAGAEQVALELTVELRFAGQSHDVFFRISDRELAFGVSELAIPLRMPRFPLGAGDVADPDATLAAVEAEIAALDAIPDSERDEATRAELGRLGLRRFMLQQVLGVRGLVDPAAHDRYHDLVSVAVGMMETSFALTAFDTGTQLVLSDVRFGLPFADPRNIGLSGRGRLEGLPGGDPALAAFKEAVEGIELVLGLSAEQLYLSVESEVAIPLPDFGRYPGGSVKLSRFTIGYGYTRNAFSVAFAGELVLPPQLVADADTSDVVGAGIRLPTHSAVGFKLDLIPVEVGAVRFVVPLVEFDVDLRSPDAPALASSRGCEPYWDGLQVVVPGLYRSSLKHVAFAPLFGMLPIPNARFDGDVAVGDEHLGYTIIADDVLMLFGVPLGSGGMVPIPLLASVSEPYFDNLCVNVRLGEFEVNVNVQRPFPSLSPLALFEALGLLADPMMPLEAGGALANTMRISLTDAFIRLPAAVVALFPETGAVVDKTAEVTLNLGTLVTVVQALARAAGPVLAEIDDTSRSMQARLQAISSGGIDVSPAALLAALPPELRKVRLGASFNGFEARAVLLLADARDRHRLRAEFALREHGSQPAPPPQVDLDPDQPLSPGEIAEALGSFRPDAGGGRVHDPHDPGNSLFSGMEFAAFDANDLNALPPAAGPGVVLGAHVKVLDGQRFRFLGFLFADGSYALVTALDIAPLRVRVAGLAVDLPLSIEGRLTLAGRAKRDGGYSAVTAGGWGVWNVLPGVVRLEVGSAGQPVSLRVHGDGAFALQGEVRVLLFNGAAVAEGSIDVSPTHCFVDAELRYRAGGTPASPVVDLTLAGRGRIGPGRGFEISGGGSLAILGQELAGVTASVTERGAAVAARLDAKAWPVGAGTVTCDLSLDLHGEIDLSKKAVPAFAFTGEGRLGALGAEIRGSAAVRSRDGTVRAHVDGRLRWHGRDWLEGRLELAPDGVHLSGRTTFALPLTPSALGGTHLAHLYLRIEVGGSFRLQPAGGLAAFDLHGDWLLAARLPGAGEQDLPLAMQSFSASGSATLAAPLVDVSGFKLLRLPEGAGELTIPVPVLQATDQPDPVRFRTVYAYDDPFDDDTKWYYPEFRWKGVSLPFPAAISNTSVTGEIPLGWELGVEEVSLPLELDLSGAFTLRLVWQDGRLAVEVQRPGHQPWTLPL